VISKSISIIEVVSSIFINRTDIWYKQYVTKNGDTGYTCRGFDKQPLPALTDGHIQAHLDGRLTISTLAVSEAGTCKWICFDSDKADATLDRIDDFLRQVGLTPQRESKRTSKDGHSWLFFDKPIPADKAVMFWQFVKAAMQLTPEETHQIEYFPRSVDRTSQVRLPLGKHLKPGSGIDRGWFEGADHAIEAQIDYLVNIKPDDGAKIVRLADLYHALTPPARPAIYRQVSSREFIDHDLRPFIGPTRRSGKELIAACPLCQLEGGDNHGDNLRLSLDGKKVNCVKNGPNEYHKTSEIYAFFGLKSSFPSSC